MTQNQRESRDSNASQTRHQGAGTGARIAPGKSTLVQMRYGGVVQKSGDGEAGPQPTRGSFLGYAMWIVADDYQGQLPGENWIYQRYKTEFEALYAQIESGSTTIKITETDSTGTAHDGFKTKILKAIRKLMCVVPGRSLMKQLTEGGHDVTIRPRLGARATAGSTAGVVPGDRTNGVGTGSIIEMDPIQSNNTVKVFDSEGNEISFPFYINLGHELIHALHNQEGVNARGTAATDAAYSNREEELTIDGPGLSENALRRSFGLEERHGHGGRVTGDVLTDVEGGFNGG